MMSLSNQIFKETQTFFWQTMKMFCVFWCGFRFFSIIRILSAQICFHWLYQLTFSHDASKYKTNSKINKFGYVYLSTSSCYLLKCLKDVLQTQQRAFAKNASRRTMKTSERKTYFEFLARLELEFHKWFFFSDSRVMFRAFDLRESSKNEWMKYLIDRRSKIGNKFHFRYRL